MGEFLDEIASAIEYYKALFNVGDARFCIKRGVLPCAAASAYYFLFHLGISVLLGKGKKPQRSRGADPGAGFDHREVIKLLDEIDSKSLLASRLPRMKEVREFFAYWPRTTYSSIHGQAPVYINVCAMPPDEAKSRIEQITENVESFLTEYMTLISTNLKSCINAHFWDSLYYLGEYRPSEITRDCYGLHAKHFEISEVKLPLAGVKRMLAVSHRMTMAAGNDGSGCAKQ